MKKSLLLTTIVLLASPFFAAKSFAAESVATEAEAKPEYLKRARPLTAAAIGKNNYAVLDNDIWIHAQPDLADLRIYTAEGQPVAYRLGLAETQSQATELPVHMMELGRSAQGTRFVLDMGSDAEFNRVTLDLKTENFVAQATVEGMHDLAEKSPTKMGPFTLYDFSKEDLGSNSILKLPDSRFRYLRVTLSKEVVPADVTGATVQRTREGAMKYADWDVTPQIKQEGRNTVITWDGIKQVPLDRVRFIIEGVNFMRPSRLETESCNEQHKCAWRTITSGEISRIRMSRNGRDVKSENMELCACGAHGEHYRVVIDNGSDVPLPITNVQVASIERRIYFRPQTQALRLFYGDEKLTAPTYDYAKLFDESQTKDAAAATLGAPADNVSYQARPDDRPFTDQHPAILWTVLILAVLGLGSVALKGLKN